MSSSRSFWFGPGDVTQLPSPQAQELTDPNAPESSTPFTLRDLADHFQRNTQHFLGRRLLFCGEPQHGWALLELMSELGAEICAMYMYGGENALEARQRTELAELPDLRFEPPEPEVIEGVQRWQRQGVHLLVTNGHMLELLRPDIPWVEWGYPSYYTHFISEQPYLGYRGCLAFLDRLAAQLARSLY